MNMMFFEKHKLHFQEFLSFFAAGELSENDVTSITDALQGYININMSVTILENAEDFSETCNLKNCTTYKIINNNFVVQKIETSRLLVASKDVKVSILESSRDLSENFEDTVSLSGAICFPNDRMSFVFILHETFKVGKRNPDRYCLTIFAPVK